MSHLSRISPVIAVALSFVSIASAQDPIVVWGDSMASDLIEERLQDGLKAVGAQAPDRPIANLGSGGQSSFQVAVRQGAIPWTAEVVSGKLPASGEVELINHRTPLKTEFAERYPGEFLPDLNDRGSGMPRLNERRTVWVEIAGVRGVIETVTQEKDRKFLFHRAEPGEEIAVENPVELKVVAHGPEGGWDIDELNRRIAVLWPFGPHFPNNIYHRGDHVSPGLAAEAEMAVVAAMLERLEEPRRFILLDRMLSYPPPSYETNRQRDQLVNRETAEAYETNYPENYYDFIPDFATGREGVLPAREWLKKNHLEVFEDPEFGWYAELAKSDKGYPVVLAEPKAVAKIELLEDGGQGVTETRSADTITEGGTEFLKVGLRVGISAENGVATAITVREGGRGYEVGDEIRIPSGAIGNEKDIVGKVTELREETIGTVRNPDGSIDIENSYSQWDIDNGYTPRCMRRDSVHFTPIGALYLSHLVAAELKARGW